MRIGAQNNHGRFGKMLIMSRKRYDGDFKANVTLEAMRLITDTLRHFFCGAKRIIAWLRSQ